MVVSAGVLKLALVSPASAVPPEATSYHRYCPLVPPAASSVAVPGPQLDPALMDGAFGRVRIVAFTSVRLLSQVPLLMAT